MKLFHIFQDYTCVECDYTHHDAYEGTWSSLEEARKYCVQSVYEDADDGCVSEDEGCLTIRSSDLDRPFTHNQWNDSWEASFWAEECPGDPWIVLVMESGQMIGSVIQLEAFDPWHGVRMLEEILEDIELGWIKVKPRKEAKDESIEEH